MPEKMRVPTLAVDLLFFCAAGLATAALIVAAAMLLQTYEHARFSRSRRRQKPQDRFCPRVELFVPCKGIDSGFRSLVEAVLKQHYPAYAVTFVVESQDDPAWPCLQERLSQPLALPVRILVAGHSRGCGQKVHNLLFATASLDSSVEVVAFLDSDVCLPLDWLRLLVQPLQKSSVGAVTGYRWFVPAVDGWSSAVLSALNGAVALLLGNHPWNGIWGGSWGIRRSTFEAAAIRQAWQGALTEDYPAWKAIRKTGLRVVFEPGCLLASPTQCTWSTLIEFGRRQYLITRVYAPGLWWLAFLGELLFSLAFWGGLALEAGHWLAREGTTWISLALATLYALATVRAGFRQSVASAMFPEWHDALCRARILDIWAQPVLSLCNLGLVLMSAFGRRVTWRGIRYQLDGPEQTQVLSYRRAQEGPE